jgi:hypothetical protein
MWTFILVKYKIRSIKLIFFLNKKLALYIQCINSIILNFIENLLLNNNQWLNSNQEFLTCPVCKNGISLKSIIPIYTKGEDDED